MGDIINFVRVGVGAGRCFVWEFSRGFRIGYRAYFLVFRFFCFRFF